MRHTISAVARLIDRYNRQGTNEAIFTLVFVISPWQSPLRWRMILTARSPLPSSKPSFLSGPIPAARTGFVRNSARISSSEICGVDRRARKPTLRAIVWIAVDSLHAVGQYRAPTIRCHGRLLKLTTCPIMPCPNIRKKTLTVRLVN